MNRSVWAEGSARIVGQLSTLELSITPRNSHLDLTRGKDQEQEDVVCLWGVIAMRSSRMNEVE